MPPRPPGRTLDRTIRVGVVIVLVVLRKSHGPSAARNRQTRPARRWGSDLCVAAGRRLHSGAGRFV